MPRPGPRPYECVRRAWHSDRHQPIRGSLIQEIFRVVNEIHSSITKKNKEWQEKLPVVVLKAEEIMYSKANSEAEYMDLKTLWERTNDAVNTIIRRDEETETGDFLQPCIEAALNLGCSPRKTSRSQRNLNPSCYFGSNTPLNTNTSSNAKQETNTNNPQVHQYLNFIQPSTILSGKLSSSFSEGPNKHNVCTSNISPPPYSSKNVPLPKTITTTNLWSPIEKYLASTAYSIYPLYDTTSFGQFGEELQSCSNVVLRKFSQNPYHKFHAVVPDKVTQTQGKDIHEESCDLSLRLGPLSLVGGKHGEVVKVNKEGSTMRKRKAVFNQNTDEDEEREQFCWQLKLPYNELTGHHIKGTGV